MFSVQLQPALHLYHNSRTLRRLPLPQPTTNMCTPIQLQLYPTSQGMLLTADAICVTSRQQHLSVPQETMQPLCTLATIYPACSTCCNGHTQQTTLNSIIVCYHDAHGSAVASAKCSRMWFCHWRNALLQQISNKTHTAVRPRNACHVATTPSYTTTVQESSLFDAAFPTN